MFSFLNLLSQGLNYFGFFNIGNRGNKILNQVYIVAGILGDLYLFYAAYRFVMNGYFLHGILILVASIALIYFLYINFYYYFLHREAPFDVSPRIEKKLGLSRFNQQAARSLSRLQNLSERGWRAEIHQIRRSIPAKLTMDHQNHLNFRAMIRDMVRGGHLRTDYAGLGRRQLIHDLKRNHHRPIYAIGVGALVPVHSLQDQHGTWMAFAGNDSAHERWLGEITRVGLQRMAAVDFRSRSLRPILTSVVLVGGPYLVMGRSRVYEHDSPYRLQVNVRFERQRP